MRIALRFLVLVVALCVVGSSAAFLQSWVHHRAVERQHHAASAASAEELELFRQYRGDQQKAFVTLMGVSFVALVMVALIPLRRADPDNPKLKQVRKEIKTTEEFALAAVTQKQELLSERDVRRRTEQSLQLQQRIVSQTLEEKVRLGRDLHDGTIQSLYATGLVMQSAKDLLPRDPAEAARRLDTALKTINDTIGSVRTHINGLTPGGVRRDSLIAVFRATAEELRAVRDVVFDFKIDDPSSLRITPAQLAQIVPLVREAMSNALRHGHARHIAVRMHEDDNAVCLLVQDDGRGFSPSTPDDGGHGLANMQARAESMGARLTLTSSPESGTRVVLILPLQS